MVGLDLGDVEDFLNCFFNALKVFQKALWGCPGQLTLHSNEKSRKDTPRMKYGSVISIVI